MKYRNQSGSAHVVIIIIIIVAILGALGFVFIRSINEAHDKGLGYGSSIDTNCKGSSGTVQMKHSPMDISDVGSILPTGLLAGPHVTPIDHLYFYPKDMTHRDAAPVYAMADGFITGYSVRTQNVQGGEQKAEYRLFIQYTCDFYSYYDLMTSLDDSISGQMKEGDIMHVPIKAGQVLGRVGAQSLDTAIYNYAMTLPGFVNPASYVAEDWKIHTDDFFKYFDEPLKSQMLALNPRKVEPYGGKIDYDVAGKLQGNWFLEGTNGYAGPPEYANGQNPDGKGYWKGHFSIAPDAVRTSEINISFGDYKGQATQFTAISAEPNPANVGVSDGIVKYDLMRYVSPTPTPDGKPQLRNMTVVGSVLLQVLDGNKLKMEAFPDQAASTVSSFTSAAKIYTR